MAEQGKQPDSPAEGVIEPRDPESSAFVRGLMARHQAARPDKDGKLPPGATHEIIGEAENGLPIVRRRRFSMH
jgi:hypothetical protein